jgi:hypothetical protein
MPRSTLTAASDIESADDGPAEHDAADHTHLGSPARSTPDVVSGDVPADSEHTLTSAAMGSSVTATPVNGRLGNEDGPDSKPQRDEP